MTQEEWDSVKLELSRPWGRVQLMVDGYQLTLVVGQLKPLKFAIAIYVNGIAKGEWVRGGCEEAKRFLRPVTKRLHSSATLKRITQDLSKTAAQKFIKRHGLDKTVTLYDLSWPSFAPLKRHLIANNKSIELVKEEA